MLSCLASMDLRPLTVQTSSAVSELTPLQIIISARDYTLPFPGPQDCQVSPAAVGFGRRLAEILGQAGSCSIHQNSMTSTENVLL